MNFEELWIGDRVFSKSIGKNVTFEGIHESVKCKVSYKSQLLFLPKSDIKKAIKEDKPKQILAKKKIKNSFQVPSDSIDLHYNILFPNHKKPIQTLMLKKQLEKMNTYLDLVISYKRNNVLIIHGKGEGVLKREVVALLEQNPMVKFIIDKNEGGASEVWFQY